MQIEVQQQQSSQRTHLFEEATKDASSIQLNHASQEEEEDALLEQAASATE